MHVELCTTPNHTLSPWEYISVKTTCLSQHLVTYGMYQDTENYYLTQKFHMVCIKAMVD